MFVVSCGVLSSILQIWCLFLSHVSPVELVLLGYVVLRVVVHIVGCCGLYVSFFLVVADLSVVESPGLG